MRRGVNHKQKMRMPISSFWRDYDTLLAKTVKIRLRNLRFCVIGNDQICAIEKKMVVEGHRTLVPKHFEYVPNRTHFCSMDPLMLLDL